MGPLRLRDRAGATLVEVVLVIVIASLLSGLVTSFILRPSEAYRDVRRRGQLVDLADNALRRLARDVRAALPNSLRVSGDGRTIEFVHTVDGGAYRAAPGVNPSSEDHTAATDWLDFTSSDAQWNVLGRLDHLSFSYGVALSAGHRVAIYTTDAASLYDDAANDTSPGVITPSATTITIADDTDEDAITLSSAHAFEYPSPRQRMFLVDGPVTYQCDLGSGELSRYASYSFASSQPTNPAAAPLSAASAALVATNVTACAFSYDAGTLTRAGLLTLELTVADGGEQARLLHQVHVDTSP